MTTPQSMEERFRKGFENVVLGVLSGDKKSPVFVNNDLEIPRLLHFIRAEKELSKQEGREEAVDYIRNPKHSEEAVKGLWYVGDGTLESARNPQHND